MNIYDTRRKNLKALLESRFDGMVSRMALLLDMAPPQIYRWISKNPDSRQNIHEQSARNIEQRLSLEPGYLDRHEQNNNEINDIKLPSYGTGIDPTTKKLHGQIEILTPEQRTALWSLLKSFAKRG